MAVLSDAGVDTVGGDVDLVDELTVRRRDARRRRLRTAGLLVFDAAVVVVFWLVAVNSVFPLSFWLRVPEPAVATVLGVVLGVVATAGAAWVHRAVRGDDLLGADGDVQGEPAWDDDAARDRDDAGRSRYGIVGGSSGSTCGGSGRGADDARVVDLTAAEDGAVDLTAVEDAPAEGASWGRKGVRRRRRNR